jgi:DNA repair exonuclease SbcCD ATPase subunit
MLSNVVLDIKNFKSIKSKTLELSNGMTLIKGPSGVGKSTIIESLLYAITGKPKMCKPLGSSCSTRVSLSFLLNEQVWTIVRSTRPGRLLVTRAGTDVEGDEAQALIEIVFGKNFDIVSHIPQDTSKSFAKMKPAEKLSFMEQLSIGSGVSAIKSKAKQYLSDMKRDYNVSSAKYSLRSDDLSKLQKVETPKKLLPKKPSDRDIKDVQREKNLIRSTIRETKLRLEKVEKEKKSIEQARSSLQTNKLRIKSFDKEINELSKELGIEKVCDETEDIMNNTKEALDASREFHSLQSELPVWSKSDEWEEENKKWMKNKNKELKDVKDSIKVAESKDIVFFKCPSCDDDIGYNCLTSEAVLPETVPNIEATKTYSIRDLMRKESKINRELSERKKKVKEVKRLKKLIADLTDEWGEDSLDDVNELEETYAMAKELDKLVRKRSRILSTLEEEEDFSDDKVDELESIINEEKAKLHTASDQFDRVDRLLSDIEQWIRETEGVRRYNENIDRAKKVYNEAVEKKRLAAIDMDNKTKLLKGAEEFKAAVQEAESLALVGQVNSLNDHAAMYLDSIFIEDPIEVSLKTFSETKSSGKIKPSIKTEIQYKENEMTLSALSGGEQARVVIAYTLALGDIMGSPICMLDEVTANLDAEMTEIIFETVKSNTENKIVIAVAHQCVDGIFNNIINF